MTTLSKEDVVRMAEESGAVIYSQFEDQTLNILTKFAALARADLVAENERLKEMAMFFSTYTDPDELEMDEIENAARESFRRANSGVKGATITRANSYESHVIWATKARISKEITTTRTALAAAEADNEWLRDALKETLECGEDGDWQSARRVLAAALDQPHDDSTLRRLLAEAKAGVYEECAKVCENSDRYRGDYFAAKIRELAEKAKE